MVKRYIIILLFIAVIFSACNKAPQARPLTPVATILSSGTVLQGISLGMTEEEFDKVKPNLQEDQFHAFLTLDKYERADSKSYKYSFDVYKILIGIEITYFSQGDDYEKMIREKVNEFMGIYGKPKRRVFAKIVGSAVTYHLIWENDSKLTMNLSFVVPSTHPNYYNESKNIRDLTIGIYTDSMSNYEITFDENNDKNLRGLKILSEVPETVQQEVDKLLS